MEFRLFQIVVPIIAVLFILNIVRRYIKSKITIYELVLGVSFWIGSLLLALFPDFFSNLIANIFGIKSNVNAIIFFCIGILFFVIFKMYFMIKKQDKAITDLVRHIALTEKKEESES
ncbi:MAG: hypothetical protein ACI9VN_003476 [Patescibacteria group bacterium]|jgi:hypothetical protein